MKQATEKGERSASGIACLFHCVLNTNQYKFFHTVNLTFQKENWGGGVLLYVSESTSDLINGKV